MSLMETERTFADNMTTIVNFGGLPVESSQEAEAVLRHHVDVMKRMDKGSIEFLLALEAAKVMDAQLQEIRVRESVPEDFWFVYKIG